MLLPTVFVWRWSSLYQRKSLGNEVVRLQERFKYSNYQKSFFEEGGGWSCYISMTMMMMMMMMMVTKTMMIRFDANDHCYCHRFISYNLLLYWMFFRFFSKHYSIASYKIPNNVFNASFDLDTITFTDHSVHTSKSQYHVLYRIASQDHCQFKRH